MELIASPKKRLSRKLLFFVILTGSLLTLITTLIQLYFEYKKDFAAVHASLDFITESYVPSITTSAFDMDLVQIRLQLKGALNLDGITFVQYSETKNKTRIEISEGNPATRKDIVRTFPLSYHQGDTPVQVGVLTAIASYEDIYNRLVERIVIILATNAVKTFCAALVIFFLIQYMVTRHLTTMAIYARMRTPDGPVEPLSLMRPETKQPDELDEVVSALNDMDERIRHHLETQKTVELALTESEEKFRSIFTNSPLGIVHIDRDGTITTVNETASTIFGWSARDMDGTHALKACLDTPFPDAISKALAGETHQVEGTILSVSGDLETPVKTILAPIRSEVGQPTGAIIILEDISQRLHAEKQKKQLEALLQQAQKMETIGTLAGGIAHDFNNIIAIILGNVDLASEEIPDTSPEKTYLQEAMTACLRAKELIQQILSFSRRSQPEKEPLSVTPLVKESLKLLKAVIPASVKIEASIEDIHETILANPTQMNQVLMNLCTNAAHAMENEGLLEVTLTTVRIEEADIKLINNLKPGMYVKLSVSDTGCGIDQALKDRIFEPYFTTKPVGKGTGMGLSVVYGIVKAHDGTITVYSEPGNGATFNVYLPAIKAESSIETDAVGPVPTGSERILFVDDEVMLVKVAHRMLSTLGYTVIGTSNPVEALEIFRQDPTGFDLVITDMTMPDMSGTRLAKAICEIRQSTPVILCTGHSEMINGNTPNQAGVTKILMKPLTKRFIASVIRDILDRQ